MSHAEKGTKQPGFQSNPTFQQGEVQLLSPAEYLRIEREKLRALCEQLTQELQVLAQQREAPSDHFVERITNTVLPVLQNFLTLSAQVPPTGERADQEAGARVGLIRQAVILLIETQVQFQITLDTTGLKIPQNNPLKILTEDRRNYTPLLPELIDSLQVGNRVVAMMLDTAANKGEVLTDESIILMQNNLVPLLNRLIDTLQRESLEDSEMITTVVLSITTALTLLSELQVPLVIKKKETQLLSQPEVAMDRSQVTRENSFFTSASAVDSVAVESKLDINSGQADKYIVQITKKDGTTAKGVVKIPLRSPQENEATREKAAAVYTYEFEVIKHLQATAETHAQASLTGVEVRSYAPHIVTIPVTFFPEDHPIRVRMSELKIYSVEAMEFAPGHLFTVVDSQAINTPVGKAEFVRQGLAASRQAFEALALFQEAGVCKISGDARAEDLRFDPVKNKLIILDYGTVPVYESPFKRNTKKLRTDAEISELRESDDAAKRREVRTLLSILCEATTGLRTNKLISIIETSGYQLIRAEKEIYEPNVAKYNELPTLFRIILITAEICSRADTLMRTKVDYAEHLKSKSHNVDEISKIVTVWQEISPHEIETVLAELITADVNSLQPGSNLTNFISKYLPTLQLGPGSADLLRGRENRGGSDIFELRLLQVCKELNVLTNINGEHVPQLDGKIKVTSVEGLRQQAGELLTKDSVLLRGIKVGFQKHYDNALNLIKEGSAEFDALPPQWKRIFVFAVAFLKINIAVVNAGHVGFDNRAPRFYAIVSEILNNSLSTEQIDEICEEYERLLNAEACVNLRAALEEDVASFTTQHLHA
jgi:hypothetical protein